MDYEKLNMQRYATKKFDGKKISQENLNKIKEIVRFTPSSYNFQPWKIKVIDNLEILEQLEKASLFNRQISNCSHLFVFCVPKNLENNKVKLFSLMENSGMPAEILDYVKNLINNSIKDLSEEQTINFASNQTYLALQNLMMAAKSLGIDSCPVEGFEKDKYQEILNISEEYVPVVICPIGYAADEQREKARFNEEEIFF